MDVHFSFKRMKPGYRFETSAYDLFQVILVRRGLLMHTVRNRDTEVRPGGVVLLPLGSRFTLHCDGTEYDGIGICIRDDIDPPYRGAAVVLTATPEIMRLTSLLEKELLEGSERAEFLRRHLGLAICEWAVRLALQGKGREDTGTTACYWAERVRDRLDMNLGTDRNVREILDGLGLSYRQLARHFRARTGLTPKQHQLRLRIEEAKRLLRDTDLSMISVAMELGFPSSQHFSTQFARFVKVTPSTYRKQSSSA